MVLFLAALVSVPALQCARRPALPKDLAELAERIKARHPEWYLVPTAASEDIRSGYWVCDRPRRREQLIHLVPVKEFGSNWRGVVLCQARGKYHTGEIVGHKEERDMPAIFQRVDPFTFFGDTQMVDDLGKIVSGSW
jgi:hypothetical protein